MKDILKGICGFFCLACFLAMVGTVGACEWGNISEVTCLIRSLALLGGSGIFYIGANFCECIKK